MTEHYSNGLARMDLKADTKVTIQVDLNMGWYAYDFLCVYPRGDGLGRRVRVGGNVHHVFLVRPHIQRQLLVFITREKRFARLLNYIGTV